MRNRVSFWFLLATVLIVGALFFKVIEPFLAPLFFAAVLALLVYPLSDKLGNRWGGRRRAAAALTALVLLLCLAPIGVALVVIGREVMEVGQELSQKGLEQQPLVQRLIDVMQKVFPQTDWESLRTSVVRGLQLTSRDIFTRTQDLLSNVISFLVGVAVMGLSLYYFLAEGASMIRKLHRLSPLENQEESVLFEEFGRVCRGVVLGTLVCAIVQAGLVGLGLWIAGVEQVWALTGLALLCSMVPLLGSTVVWGPVTIWLLWQGSIGSAVFLGLYGALVVSTSDNLIRAYVLHDTAGMHPLLAFVSALGGLSLVGAWGIFLGPIVAALFYTLLKVLHDRLERGADRQASDKISELSEHESSPTQPPRRPSAA